MKPSFLEDEEIWTWGRGGRGVGEGCTSHWERLTPGAQGHESATKHHEGSHSVKAEHQKFKSKLWGLDLER